MSYSPPTVKDDRNTRLLPFSTNIQRFCDQRKVKALTTSINGPGSKFGRRRRSVGTDNEDTESETYCGIEDGETHVDVEGADAASVRALSSCSKGTVPSRERKSIPLTKTFSTSQTEPTPKQMLKDLVKLSNELLTYDSDDVAKEITRYGELGYF
jgi:hypothetical protein